MYRNVNIFISIVIISSRCNAEVFIVDPDFEFVRFELFARHHALESFESSAWPIELFRTGLASRWVANMPLETHRGRASELWRCHESQDLPLASMTPCSSSTSYQLTIMLPETPVKVACEPIIGRLINIIVQDIVVIRHINE
jgi:predicted cupin superfamily sugar epimerase